MGYRTGIDYNGYAVLNAAFMITILNGVVSPEYLLAILNSKLLRFVWTNRYLDRRKDFPKIKGDYLKLLPIFTDINNEQQRPFIDFVNQILTVKKNDHNADTSALENEIDLLVYKLYDLNDAEIAIIETENS